MNIKSPTNIIVAYAFRFWLIFRRFFPRKKCQAFSATDFRKEFSINSIFVINLNRAQERWVNMQKELRRILDSSGNEILNITERQTAIDAKEFIEDPIKDKYIDPFYTLADQLFVEPQPLVMPTHLDLDYPIRMSRAEVAVAMSHINIWKKIAEGIDNYVLILEDDIWFHTKFSKSLNESWSEIMRIKDEGYKFDLLYVSYQEVKNGAPKSFVSKNVFRPVRGLWNLSGYILSREGAKKLISLLPCRGPIDLWINLHFKSLNILATKNSIIGQRRDVKSSNLYSILPVLSKIGAINSEGASLFNIRPTELPVFVFGVENSGLTSIAMALSMLGYRCCNDLEDLPSTEMTRLIEGNEKRIFDAYVNIKSLMTKTGELRSRFPNAKFIVSVIKENSLEDVFQGREIDIIGADILFLNINEPNKWRVICEYLRCAPPASSFPLVSDIGQRKIFDKTLELDNYQKTKILKNDISPWVVKRDKYWNGIHIVSTANDDKQYGILVKVRDYMKILDSNYWLLRNDTFTDNLALFRPANVDLQNGKGAILSIKKESLGVREYSAASICSINEFLYGKFEAKIQASGVPGVVTGIFLYRNSPRQEIDIEIVGNKTSSLLINVFYNPGDIGANFDYGYRGTPISIDLGFDASKESHIYTIEWYPNEIRWLVDNTIVYKRVIWDPTPIPNLPMTFHVNCWLTRSAQLAGKINKKHLPTATIVEEIAFEAYSIPSLEIEQNYIETELINCIKLDKPNENIII